MATGTATPFCSIGRDRLLDGDRAGLELRHPRRRVERVAGQGVDAGRAAPVERHEHGVRPDAGIEPGVEHRAAPRGGQAHGVAVGDAVPAGQLGVQLDVRARDGRGERRAAPGLRARLVLRAGPAGGQQVRVRLVGQLGGEPGPDREEVGAPVRGGEAVEEHARGAGVVLGRARPEELLAGGQAFVGDPGVVGDPAGAGPPQLGEDLLGVGREELPRPSRSAIPRQICRSLRTPGGGSTARAAQQHPALGVGHRAALLGPLGGGQHDVGELGGLGQEDVGDGEEVQRLRAAPRRGARSARSPPGSRR